jgi:hypothetical protein
MAQEGLEREAESHAHFSREWTTENMNVGRHGAEKRQRFLRPPIDRRRGRAVNEEIESDCENPAVSVRGRFFIA